jgi:hypothetical protein
LNSVIGSTSRLTYKQAEACQKLVKIIFYMVLGTRENISWKKMQNISFGEGQEVQEAVIFEDT